MPKKVMKKKFSTREKAARFAKGFGMKLTAGASTKMADGSKGRWYSLTKKAKK